MLNKYENLCTGLHNWAWSSKTDPTACEEYWSGLNGPCLHCATHNRVAILVWCNNKDHEKDFPVLPKYRTPPPRIQYWCHTGNGDSVHNWPLQLILEIPREFSTSRWPCFASFDQEDLVCRVTLSEAPVLTLTGNRTWISHYIHMYLCI